METVKAMIMFLVENKESIFDGIAYSIAAASIIVKLTPTLKDDNVLKGIVKFLGKYIALDKYGPKGDVK